MAILTAMVVEGKLEVSDETFHGRVMVGAEEAVQRPVVRGDAAEWVGPLQWKWADGAEVVAWVSDVPLALQRKGAKLKAVNGQAVDGKSRLEILEVMRNCWEAGLELMDGTGARPPLVPLYPGPVVSSAPAWDGELSRKTAPRQALKRSRQERDLSA
mmetsp:Transcript_24938/g.56551  ORF Transcript_24938/g.56551 Transcript_24938/m.56551 type:complete len:157 (+) Transcript_24938:227-697(+)